MLVIHVFFPISPFIHDTDNNNVINVFMICRETHENGQMVYSTAFDNTYIF